MITYNMAQPPYIHEYGVCRSITIIIDTPLSCIINSKI